MEIYFSFISLFITKNKKFQSNDQIADTLVKIAKKILTKGHKETNTKKIKNYKGQCVGYISTTKRNAEKESSAYSKNGNQLKPKYETAIALLKLADKIRDEGCGFNTNGEHPNPFFVEHILDTNENVIGIVSITNLNKESQITCNPPSDV